MNRRECDEELAELRAERDSLLQDVRDKEEQRNTLFQERNVAQEANRQLVRERDASQRDAVRFGNETNHWVFKHEALRRERDSLLAALRESTEENERLKTQVGAVGVDPAEVGHGLRVVPTAPESGENG